MRSLPAKVRSFAGLVQPRAPGAWAAALNLHGLLFGMHRLPVLMLAIVAATELFELEGRAAVPPLSAEEREVLAAAVDGPPGLDAALLALVDHVRRWPLRPGGFPEAGDAPVRHRAEIDRILAAPGDYRGDLFLLEGVVQQQADAPSPQGELTECFIRDRSGRAMLVYLVGGRAEGRPGQREPDRLREGERIQVLARFGRVVRLSARDGRERPYPVLVGRVIRGLRPAGPALPLTVLVVVIVIMGSAFLLLLVLTRRSRARAPARWTGRAPPGADRLDADPALPDDPAEALAELQRRAAASPVSQR